jgi:hypothetical protein
VFLAAALSTALVAPSAPAWNGASQAAVADRTQAPAPTAPVQAEVMLIHASNQEGGIDPRIGKMPKFGDYKSYRLLSRSNVVLQKAAPAATRLPNGRVLQISLKDVQNSRYTIDTSIQQADGSAFLPLVEVKATVDVPVFFAGQTYEGGMLVIGIKVLPR